MSRIYILAAIVAVALAIPVSAMAGGDFTSVNDRYYSSYIHLSIGYDVFPDDNCLPDEWGDYSDPVCYNYDDNDADIDVQVFAKGRYGGYRHRVYADSFSGFSGRASEDLYMFEFDRYCPHKTLHYRWLVRLFDPSTDQVVDRWDGYFRTFCHR